MILTLTWLSLLGRVLPVTAENLQDTCGAEGKEERASGTGDAEASDQRQQCLYWLQELIKASYFIFLTFGLSKMVWCYVEASQDSRSWDTGLQSWFFKCLWAWWWGHSRNWSLHWLFEDKMGGTQLVEWTCEGARFKPSAGLKISILRSRGRMWSWYCFSDEVLTLYIYCTSLLDVFYSNQAVYYFQALKHVEVKGAAPQMLPFR